MQLCAFLVEKRETREPSPCVVQRQYDNLKNHYFYTVSFEIDSNTTWTFRVPVEIINVISVGQQGVLTYREKNSKLYFVFFSSFNDSNQSR